MSVALPTLVVIARGLGTEQLLPAVDAMVEAGVSAVEVTLNSPAALASIAALARRHGSTLSVGAGTVRTPADVPRAADAGARFLLSPHTDEQLIAETKRLGLLSVPGAFTPTEIQHAWSVGADVVKVFPLHTAGATHIAAVREPLDDIPLLGCGGLSAQRGRDCLRAGCVSIGVGIGLIGGQALAERDWPGLTAATATYLDEVTR